MQTVILSCDEKDLDRFMQSSTARLYVETVAQLRQTTQMLENALSEIGFITSENADIAADKLKASYQSGYDDALTKMQGDLSYKSLFGMLAYETVKLCLAPGVVPILFSPMSARRWEVCTHLFGVDVAREHTSNSVGIIGMDNDQNKLMFVTQIEYWTLAPST